MSSPTPTPTPTPLPAPRPNLPSPAAARPTTHQDSVSSFTFPKTHSFPALYTLQPNPTTRIAQLQKWSRIIQLYCRYHRLFRLRLPACLSLPLFSNGQIRRALGERDVREVLGWMASEGGAMRGEWDGDNGASRKDVFWVYWKRPEDWGQRVWEWVDAVGQRGVVLTVYELLYGEGTVGQDFHEMDPELFTKALNTLVKKGKAQVFGDADSRGVKFF